MAFPILLVAAAAAAGTTVAYGESQKHTTEGLKLADEDFTLGDVGSGKTATKKRPTGKLDATGNPILEDVEYALDTDYGQLARDQQGRGAARTAGARIDTQNQAEFRSGQQGLMEMLRARAAGETQSAAELQMARGQDRNSAAARSLAVSAQGVSPAMALRSAQEAQANSNNATLADTSILRAQEQAQAEGMYGQMLSGAREQDIGLATSQAGFDQQTNLANMQSEVQQKQLNDQMTQFYMSQGFNVEQAKLQAKLALEKMKIDQNLGVNAQNQQAQRDTQNFYTGIAGAASGAVGTAASGAGAAAASDRRVKTKVKKTKKELDKFMDALTAYSYKYKDEKHGVGERTSIMAQDAEKSSIGKMMVSENKEGTKIVDYGKGLGSMLAGVARLNERLRTLEGDK